MQTLAEKLKAPEWRVSHWINTPEPLSLHDLRGRVVLVDFWDYTCINCLHTLPYLIAWHKRYADCGLTIVGIHAPEFTFAKDPALIGQAVRDCGIPYPVGLDNEFRTWDLYANRAWPAKYLIDPDGYVVAYHYGEGAYAEFEERIQRLLVAKDPALKLPELLEPLRRMDVPGTLCYRPTPELYLGTGRGEIGNLPEGDAYTLPAWLEDNMPYLQGRWESRKEYIESHGTPDDPALIVLKYNADEVNIVMAPREGQVIDVYVGQDGGPITLGKRGDDVTEDGAGQPRVRVDRPRMVRLVKNHGFETHSLTLRVAADGLRAYAFTFVSCPSEETALA